MAVKAACLPLMLIHAEKSSALNWWGFKTSQFLKSVEGCPNDLRKWISRKHGGFQHLHAALIWFRLDVVLLHREPAQASPLALRRVGLLRMRQYSVSTSGVLQSARRILEPLKSSIFVRSARLVRWLDSGALVASIRDQYSRNMPGAVQEHPAATVQKAVKPLRHFTTLFMSQ
jgi:hypothetical protein